MPIEYIIIIILAILPLINRFSFWLYLIQLKEYRWDRFKEYICTKQWRSALFSFWFFIELPVFIFSLFIFFKPEIESLVFPIVVYFLILQNIFVLWKLFRKKTVRPKYTRRMLVLSLAIILDFLLWTTLILLYFHKFIYIILFSWLLFPHAIIFIWNFILLPIINYKKNKFIDRAIDRSLSIKNITKIWITWSYWKTSIKEFLFNILKDEWKTLKTPKNINTELWTSEIIMNKLTDKYDYFIAEMWAYRIWEIEMLWEIVNHKYWFLTAIWSQHLGLFWSIENTIKAKSEIFLKVLENKWTLYVNWDDKNIRSIKFPAKLKLIKYWVSKEWSDAKSKIISMDKWLTDFSFSYKHKEYNFKTNLIWVHNILNITWIIAFALDLWISKEKMSDYLMKMKLPKDTLEVVQFNDLTLINDTYNLSEKWLMAWVKVLKYFNWEKILILDDILELWKESNIIHFNLWRKIAKKWYINKLLYVWENHEKDFIAWLVAWGFDKNNLVDNLNKVKKRSIILFEWRRAKEYFLNTKRQCIEKQL